MSKKKKRKANGSKKNAYVKKNAKPRPQFGGRKDIRRLMTPLWILSGIILALAGLSYGFLPHYKFHALWLAFVGVTFGVASLFVWAHTAMIQREAVSRRSGMDDPTVITPDSTPRPKTRLNVPDDKFLLILGDFLAWKSDLPMVALMQREEPLITLNKEPRGMSLSAKFFSADGKIVAEIDRNQIHTNPANFWRVEKTPHRLTVLNNEARIVFDVQYLNVRTVKILGRFFARGGFPIVFSEDGIQLGQSRLVESAAGEAGGAALNVP